MYKKFVEEKGRKTKKRRGKGQEKLRKTKKTIKGGGVKLVNQGTYGCVFKNTVDSGSTPTPKRGKTKKTITKLMKKKYANSEKEELSVIGKIDTEGKYHIKLEEQIDNKGRLSVYFNNDVKKQKNSKGNRCKITTGDKAIKVENASALILEDGKQDLKQYLKKETGQVITEEMFKTFLELFANLLEGVELMSENEYSHLDIKSENIVINDDEMFMKFIDFGIGFDYKGLNPTSFLEKLYEKQYLFVADYEIYPSDVILLIEPFMDIVISSVESNLDNEREIDEIVEKDILPQMDKLLLTDKFKNKNIKTRGYHFRDLREQKIILVNHYESIKNMLLVEKSKKGKDTQKEKVIVKIKSEISKKILQNIDVYSIILVLYKFLDLCKKQKASYLNEEDYKALLINANIIFRKVFTTLNYRESIRTILDLYNDNIIPLLYE